LPLDLNVCCLEGRGWGVLLSPKVVFSEEHS